MDDKMTTIFSPQRGISVRVCPRGHVYLYVGHTCLSLSKADFLDLAQIVRATENRLLHHQPAWQNEQQH